MRREDRRVNRYMPQRLFDYGVATMARIHQVKGTNIDDLVSYATTHYKTGYADRGLPEKWETGIRAALKICRDLKLSPDDADTILFTYRYYVSNFYDDGRRIPWYKRIGGTRFRYDRVPLSDPVGSFSERFARFASMAKKGTLRPEWLPVRPR